MSVQARRYVFTLNHPTADEQLVLEQLGDHPNVVYLVFGKEVAPTTGTPHLQGFIIFASPKRLSAAKAFVGRRCHLEITKGTSEQASAYCKKESDYQEFGILPQSHGKRSDFDEFKKWVLEQTKKPSPQLVAQEYPNIFIKYSRCMEWIDLIYPQPKLVSGSPRNHQQHLLDKLNETPDDRTIFFVVDETGNTGKSWFTKYMLTNFSDITQRLSIGKRDDLLYAIDESKSVFLFDVPRSQSEFLQYSVFESLKDGIIFSTKYRSRSKQIGPCHVVVFMNEQPDQTKLSADRYEVIHWHNL